MHERGIPVQAHNVQQNEHQNDESSTLESMSMLDDLQDGYEQHINDMTQSLKQIGTIREAIANGERIEFCTWLDIANDSSVCGNLLTQDDPFIAPMVIERIVIPDSNAELVSDGIKITIDDATLLLQIERRTCTNGIAAWDEYRIPHPDYLKVTSVKESRKWEKAISDLTEYGFHIDGGGIGK